MAYKYNNQKYEKEHMAKAVGVALPISTKASIEICNNLRNKSLGRAMVILEEVISKRKPIRFTRFINGAGHKKGIGPGKYPVKASREILKLLESIEANAQFKGMNTSNLIICHMSAQNAGNQWRYGRHRRRKMKRTHIEIAVKEGVREKREKAVKKTEEKKESKTAKEEKNVVKKEIKQADSLSTIQSGQSGVESN